MAKKKQIPQTRKSSAADASDSPITLKELLGADVIGKLKAQADELKAAEAAQRERKRQEEEEKRKAEQKRLDNDFEYLLNNSSSDWKKFK
ncbi:DUF3886 domain-containing protein [Cohnella thailandensis]|uniref:YqkE family protein n=1 Tax=Cohnella thailandensis TaxID=557557 RepID=A0A841T4U8_9BACL|nr:YqkE family protein [Cohnella thailandensis]MBP1973243.1 hypothetical protein [Cohnella thailandensis]